MVWLGQWSHAIALVFLGLSVISAVGVIQTIAQGVNLFSTVVSLVIGVTFTALCLLIASRVGVELPRNLRGWDEALAERAELRQRSR